MLVHVEPSVDTWIWKALAYATSQVSTTWQIPTVLPRSTCTHFWSLNWLDHRVPALPSNAAHAGVPAFSIEDAVAGLPCAALAVPQPGAPPPMVPYTWSSHSEYPQGVARVVPYIRTYRPLPAT